MGVDYDATALPIRCGLAAMATDTGTGSIAVVGCDTALGVIFSREAQIKLVVVARTDMTDTTVVID